MLHFFLILCCFFFLSFLKCCLSSFPEYAEPLLQLVFYHEWVRKPMYYSFQFTTTTAMTTTTCSDQHEQKFSNIPSISFVLTLLSYFKNIFPSFLLFLELASWLHWSGKVCNGWSGKVQQDIKGMWFVSKRKSCLAPLQVCLSFW